MIAICDCCFTTPQVSASTLPDDALLAILKLLDKKTLVRSARLVSSQWRRVSRHRSLWKDATFIASGPSRILDMRAASYVKDFSVALSPPICDELRRNLLEYDWEVQVESLNIQLNSSHGSSDRALLPRDYSLCVELFRKFSQGVSSFKITTDSQTSFPKEDVQALFDVIGKAPRLIKLSLQSRVVQSCDEPLELGELSLQELSVSGYHDTSSVIVAALVSASRSSLQSFEWTLCPSAVGAGYSSVMEELALCSLLSRVTLPLCQDFTPIATSKSIRGLKLSCPK